MVYMTTIYVISDQHFGHANILTFTREDGSLLRPGFSCVEEMNEHMVKCHNEVVRSQDHVYMLGDVAFKAPNLGILKRLNGKLRLVRGNHDIYDTKEYMKYFDEMYGVRIFNDFNFVLSHIPLHPACLVKRNRQWINIHGHLHSNELTLSEHHPDKRYFNVAVERVNYTPVTLEQVQAAVANGRTTI